MLHKNKTTNKNNTSEMLQKKKKSEMLHKNKTTNKNNTREMLQR